MKKLLLFICLPALSFAQTYTLSNTTINNVCNATVYDPAGPNSNTNYGSTTPTITMTFCAPTGCRLKYWHTNAIFTQGGYRVFDGPSAYVGYNYWCNVDLCPTCSCPGGSDTIVTSQSCITLEVRANSTSGHYNLVGQIRCVPSAAISAGAITAVGSTTFCSGDSVRLNATPLGVSYQWYNGLNLISNATSSTYYAKTSGDYKCVIYSNISCSKTSNTIVANVNPDTPIITSDGSTSLCEGDDVTLTANDATSYLWNNGATTQNILVTEAGDYYVTLTENGCSDSSSITTVAVNPLPTPSITINGSANFCQGDNTSLNSNYSQGNQWLFNGNTIVGANAQSYNPTQSGFYSLKVTDNNNCQNTSQAVSITINSLPDATISASGTTTFCQGESVLLAVGAATSYLWSNSETTQSITVFNSGNYSVAVTGANGCVSTSALTNVTVHNLPAMPTVTQNGNILMSSSSTNNQWYLDGTIINGATSQFYTVTVNGNYSVTVTGNFGCTNSSTPINVTITGVDSEISFSERVNIYPNPVTNVLTVETMFSQNTFIQIEIKNVLGQIVYTLNDNAGSGLYKKMINLNLEQGTYSLTLQTNEDRTTKKIEIIK